MQRQEKVDVGGGDSILVLVRAVACVHGLNGCRQAEAIGRDGIASNIARHPSFERGQDSLVARLWDLASAYRQLAWHPKHGSISIVASWDPCCHAVRLYQQVVLGFCSSASVHSSNWIARGLSFILLVVGLIPQCQLL